MSAKFTHNTLLLFIVKSPRTTISILTAFKISKYALGQRVNVYFAA